jgi:ABC-type transport system substrate-binding protein
VGSSPYARKIAAAARGQLAAAGVQLVVRAAPLEAFFDRVVRGPVSAYDAAILSRVAYVPDPYDFLYIQFDSHNAERGSALGGERSNFSLYSDPRLDELLETAQHTLDREQRAALYREAQRLIRREVPLIPIAHPLKTIAYHRRVRNPPLELASGGSGLELVWLDAEWPQPRREALARRP